MSEIVRITPSQGYIDFLNNDGSGYLTNMIRFDGDASSSPYVIRLTAGVTNPGTGSAVFNGSTAVMVMTDDGRYGIGISSIPSARLEIAAGSSSLGQIKLNSGTLLSTPANGILEYNGTHLYFTIGSTRYQIDQQAVSGSGTVTSVNMSVPTGFSISGNPITTSGTLALTFDTGYSLPLDTDQANWDTAFGWGNHASAGYLLASTATTTYVPQTRTLSINGVSMDLSANREWHTAYSDTGVLDFEGITIVSSTQVDVGALTGIITDNETNPNNPTHTHVSYAGGTNITVPTIASGIISYLLIDNTGTLVWQNTYPTSAERKTMIFLGKVSHPDLTSLLLSFDEPNYIISPVSALRDLYQVFNFINDNVYPYPNNTNLTFATTSGNIHGNGINFTNNNAIPNEMSYSGVTTTNFRYVTQNGTLGSVTSNIVPGSYDVSGIVTAIPGANSRATIQYVFAIPSNSGISFVIQYGQNWYTSLANAIAAVGKENFTICPGLELCGILIGVIVLRKDTTDLTDNTKAHIFKADKLGQIIGAQSGVSTATLQKAYDNSEIPQITVNPIQGILSIKSGMSVNTDTIQAWQNISGTEVAFITGEGKLGLTGLTLTLGSDATGDIFYRNSSGYFNRLGIGTNGQVLTVNTGLPSWATPTTGTVTSVGLSVPTGFAVTGSPVTTSGTLALTFDTGYSLPTTASQTNWDTAFSWGNHASVGYLLASTAATTYQPLDSDLTSIAALTTTSFGRGLLTETSASTLRTTLSLVIGTNVQAYDGDLDAIAALTGTSGLLRKTAVNTWSLDTTAYIDNTVTTLSSLTSVGTLTSGTLSTGFVVGGVTMTLGSDATGDIYYRNSGGVLTRLGVGSSGQVLTVNTGLPSWATPTTGTVTSVDMSVPTGFTIGGNPITTSGTLALAFDTGYSLPLDTDQANWDTAFSWGNHASAGYLLASTAATTYQPLDSDLTSIAALTTTSFGRGLLTETSASTLRTTLSLVIGTNVQAWDGDLDAIAALAGTSGLLRKTAINTWSLDTTAYIDNTVTTLSSLTSVGTLTTGTLGTGFVVGGVTMSLGSDATGDIYYRNSGGVLTRLGVGTSGQLLTVSSGLPAWQTLTTTIAIGTTPITSGAVGRIIFEGTGNVAQQNANFIWDNTNTRLGVGLSSPNATLDVKGIGTSSSTSSLIISNSTPTEIFRIYDSKNINIGGGSVTSGTDYKITAFGTGSLSTDITLLVSGAGGDNIITFHNSSGYTTGGMSIKRSSLSFARVALSVIGNTTTVFQLTADGTINLNQNLAAWADYDGNYIQAVTSATHGAGVQGVLYNTFGGGSTASHIFRKGRGTVSPATGAIVHLYSNYVDSGATLSGTTPFLKIAPIVNLTGSGTKNIIGIHYAPTMTSLTGGGTNVALLLESGNSGFGMSTMPTARMHVTGGTATAGTAPIKIDSGTNLTTPEDGAMEYNGTHLYFTIGSTRYQIDQQAGGGGGTVTSVALSVPTGFAVTGSPVTTSGTLALAFDTGYSLPTTASQTNWNTAFGWGNHATAGYEVALTFSTGLTRTSNTITNNLSTGIASGQSVIGGVAASETLTLSSTAHATKGKILFGTSAYDEANNMLGIGLTTPSAMLEITSGTSSVGIIQLNVGSLLTSAALGTFEYSLVGSNNVLHFTRQGTTRESVLTGVSGASAPSTTPATTVNNYYGTAGNVMLGAPATWIQVIDENGVARKIPAY